MHPALGVWASLSTTDATDATDTTDATPSIVLQYFGCKTVWIATVYGVTCLRYDLPTV